MCRPFLLQFPRDRVAVIDDVCMLHPHQAQQKQGEVGGVAGTATAVVVMLLWAACPCPCCHATQHKGQTPILLGNRHWRMCAVILLTVQDSIYAALAKVAPYDAREEEARRDAQFNYYPSGEWPGMEGWMMAG